MFRLANVWETEISDRSVNEMAVIKLHTPRKFIIILIAQQRQTTFVYVVYDRRGQSKYDNTQNNIHVVSLNYNTNSS